MDWSILPITHRVTVVERYLDRFDHVNVMWYTHLFDKATLAFFDRLGCGIAYYRKSGNAMFALEQHTRYLSELRLGETIEVRARALGRSSRRIHFMLFMMNTDTSKLSATTELIGMHIDLARRRSSDFPENVVQAIDDLLAKHRQLPWEAPACGVMSP